MRARLALGGAAIGNLYRAVTDAAAEDTVCAALEAGIGLIDTAPYYGHGLAEQRLGAALRRWRGAKPLLSSKVGRVLDPVAPGDVGDFGFVDVPPFRPRFDYSRAGVRRSLEQSFARLGVERLDIALVHDVGQGVHGAAHADVLRVVLDETLPELEEAKRAGLVGAIGLGVNEWEVCAEVLQRAPLDVVLLAGRYTLLEQPALNSGFFDLCQQRGVRVLAAGVFNSGLLATPPSASSTYNYAVAPPVIVARATELWEACTRFGAAPQAAALQFAGAHPAVDWVVVGARSAAEIADLVRWRDEAIAPQLWDDLKRRGFIAAEAPAPA